MKKEIFLILQYGRSAYNVGTIFRTPDAAGVSKIYNTGDVETRAVDNVSFEIK